jgi:hypothetical protein
MFGGVTKGRRTSLACLGGLALLLAAFWLGRTTAAPAGAPTAPMAGTDEARSEALGSELASARERVRELAAQVAWLQGQMTRVGQQAAESDPEAGPEGAGAAPSDDATAGRSEPGTWFDGQLLRDGGLPDGEVARLEAIFNEYEMKRIELTHQAEREGWANRPRYWNEMIRFQFGMREEIGDENYDVMLYATGRKNRVVMSELLEDSPAERYGFEPGDVVTGYEGQRVFHGRELRRATAQGERGEWITVDVLRDGEPLRIRAQRGPLGAKLQPARLLPDNLQ